MSSPGKPHQSHAVNMRVLAHISAVIVCTLVIGCSSAESDKIEIQAHYKYSEVSTKCPLYLTNKSPIEIYDAKMAVKVIDSSGRTLSLKERFEGRWDPEEEEYFGDACNPEKIEVSIRSRQGRRDLTLYDFSYETH